MGRGSICGFGYSMDELIVFFGSEYGKGAYHAEALFRQLYTGGNAEVSGTQEYRPAAELAEKVERDFKVCLPEVGMSQDDAGTRKFSLSLEDGAITESVIIPMVESETLCISSQVGCSRGCTFCETAGMGLLRNLKTDEIIAQWAVAHFDLGTKPRNIVFMGMGEPFDNFDAVIRAVDILSDQRGAAIPKRRISISTSGHVVGIRQLMELENRFPDRGYRTIRLAVSLNASNDDIRSRLMPINRIWSMKELKSALLDSPQSHKKDALYFEYVLIPGVNDDEQHADELNRWMEGMVAKVNLIPYHPTGSSPWSEPDEESLKLFHSVILSSGRECRTRRSRGKGIEAACGMLGKYSRLSRSVL